MHLRSLLTAQQGSGLPEQAEGKRVRILLGHHHGHLDQRRLTFEHRLRGGPAIVLVMLRNHGVEIGVLVLQGVDELVRHDDAQLLRRHVGNHEQRAGVGIVKPGDLLRE